MKNFKKIAAFVMAAVMIFSMGCMSAFAAGTTGKITITNASIDQTYTAYKILDATYNTSTKTTAYTTKTPTLFAGSPFTVASDADSQGRYAVTVGSGVTAESITTWIRANLSSFAASATETPDAGNTVEFDVPFGYYYITSTVGTVVTVDTNTPSVNVVDKNKNEPGLPDKTDDEETAQIGDSVHFTVTFDATNYVKKTDGDSAGTKITEYYVKDTPDGYDIDADTVSVKVGNTNITSLIQDKKVENGVLTFTIPWTDENGDSIYASPSTVTIQYTGKVNAMAADGQADNTVSITNNADQTAKTDAEKTKNYQLTIKKVDAQGKALTGAEFELYRNSASGTKIALVDLGNGIYRVATNADEKTTTTIQAGTAIIKGLDGNDVYYVKEIKAPDGYNLLKDPVKVEFKRTVENVVSYANVEKNIVNQSGAQLPSSGGRGTTIFYVFGAVLVMAAGFVLVMRRKATAK